jgi:hypothetical protein
VAHQAANSIVNSTLLLSDAGWVGHSRHSAAVSAIVNFHRAVAEISLLVSGLQHPAILHQHADPSAELDLRQKALHGSGKHFGGTNFAPKLGEPSFFHLSSR